MLTIHPVYAFKDNIIWVGVNDHLRLAFVVDPGDAAPVLAYLKAHHLGLAAIFITHKHWDHTHGVSELLSAYPNTPVYANALEPLAFPVQAVSHGDLITIAQWGVSFRVIHIPGHTQEHVAYYGHSALFCGDTLFGAGCGRLFEGSAQQMLASLDRLCELPNTTLIYCGHEYTLANLAFARHVEPSNLNIQERFNHSKILRDNHQSTLPSTLELELKTNPFLRCREPSVIASVESHVGKALMTTADVFRELREWKNTF